MFLITFFIILFLFLSFYIAVSLNNSKYSKPGTYKEEVVLTPPAPIWYESKRIIPHPNDIWYAQSYNHCKPKGIRSSCS